MFRKKSRMQNQTMRKKQKNKIPRKCLRKSYKKVENRRKYAIHHAHFDIVNHLFECYLPDSPVIATVHRSMYAHWHDILAEPSLCRYKTFSITLLLFSIHRVFRRGAFFIVIDRT